MYLFICVNTGSSANAKSFKRFKLKKGLIKKSKAGNFRKILDNKTHRTRIVGDQIIVKFKKNYRNSDVRKFALKNNLDPLTRIGKRTFVFAAYDTRSALSTLNHLEEDPEDRSRSLIVKADIDEYKELKSSGRRKKRSKGIAKFALERQWHLKNMGGDSVSKAGSDINVEKAWESTKGEGVIVAVIDTGFDTGHDDINFFNKGYTTVTHTYSAKAPSYSNENHGTAVAGIIAAKDNKKGSVGVAPKAKIIPIRLISDRGMVATSQIIEAHQRAVEMGAQIINNSWGSYDSSLEDGELLELSELEENLYRNLATNARNGRGVTVIFAAGNSGEGNFAAHPEARNKYTLAIGAIDSKDRKTRYSVYGTELDVVAPGGQEKGILTTDRRDRKKGGLRGYARGSYTDTFTGTSAAAPVVTGVAALILSVNPNLDAQDIKEIIRQSARKDLDNYYEFNNGKSSELGYGIVDAGAAVELAQNW